jgi:hypothetical protein
MINEASWQYQIHEVRAKQHFFTNLPLVAIINLRTP